MKKYLVSCIAVLTFGLMFAWLGIAFFKSSFGSINGYDLLDLGTHKLFTDAANARYVFLLLSIIFGAITVLAAIGASLKACGVLKVKFDLNLVVVCLLAFTALLAVLSMICSLCDDSSEGIKIGAGFVLYPLMTVLGAVVAFVARKAK